MYIVYSGQSAEKDHYISQLAFVWVEKYLVIKPPQNHILNVRLSKNYFQKNTYFYTDIFG